MYMCLYVLLVLLTMVLLAGQATYNILGWFDRGKDSGLYDHRLDKLFEEYEDQLRLYLTDAIFYLWIVIYSLQALWLFYALELSVRRADSQYLCEGPAVMPASVFILFMFGVAGNAGWLFLFDYKEEWKFAPLALLVSCLFLHVSLMISLVKLKKYESFLHSCKLTSDVLLIRLFVHNGIGLYAAGNMLVLFYNVLMEGVYYDVIDADQCVYAFVGILMAYIIIWFVAESFLVRDSMRGLLTPYATGILALGMVVYRWKDYDDTGTEFYVSAVSLALVVLLTLIAASITIGWRKPTQQEVETDEK